jgi:serine/threonine protein kinase
MFWRRADGEDRFGAYYVVRLVHDGEKSVVYQGEESPGSPAVAIKLYKRSYDRLSRELEKKYKLASEGEVGMSLNPRPGDDAGGWPIVRTLARGTEYGRRRAPRYLVMEFARGYNLKSLLACSHELVGRHRARLVLQLARALKVVHDRGLIFRDTCPENVIMDRAGVAKLIDLGFVAPAGLRFEEKSGTPSYMSPEQVLCEPLGPSTDIYSFGVVLYELITGRTPYGSETSGDTPQAWQKRMLEIMEQHVNSPVPAVPGALRAEAGHLAEVAERCMQKHPEQRFETMDAVLEALL